MVHYIQTQQVIIIPHLEALLVVQRHGELDEARVLEALLVRDGPAGRDVEDGELYNWQDWLEWERTADCATPGTSSFNGRAAVGAAVSGIGTALLVAGSGENAKSPG